MTVPMLRQIAPPACLVMALALFVVGFMLLALGRPGISVELHAARASDDRRQAEHLEQELRRRRESHDALVVASFGGGLMLGVAAFALMRDSA